MDSLLNSGSKKYFFHVLASIVSEVLPFKGVPGNTSAINKF